MFRAAFLLACTVFATSLSAQSPIATRNITNDLQPVLAALPANSPWFGAQLAVKFGETDKFAEQFLVSGRVMYHISLGLTRFQLPVVGNLSNLTQDLSSAESTNEKRKDILDQIVLQPQGLNIGLFPYYEVANSTAFLLTAHGGLSYKLNGVRNGDDDIDYLNQGRFSLGVEAALGDRTNNRSTLTLGVAHTISVFSEDEYSAVFGDEKTSLKSYEFTVVLPIANGVGALFEAILVDDESDAFRAGLVVAAIS